MGRHSRSLRIAAAGLLLAVSLALLDSSFNDNAFDFSAEEEEAQQAAAARRLAQDTFGSYYYGDDDLLWIAEEYLRAPLPAEWELVLGPAVGDLGQFGQQAELSPFTFRHRHTGEHTPRSPLHDHYQRLFIALKTEELLDDHHVAQPPPPPPPPPPQQQRLSRPDTAEQLLRDAVDSAGRVGRMGPGGSALAALSSLSAADLEQRLRSSGVDLALVKAAHERTARGLRAEQAYLRVRARVTGRKQDDTLRSVVASIRMREASMDFQFSRGAAVTAMAANNIPGVVGQRLWSEGNYGYGLVTFPAWEAIFVRPGIARDLVKPLVVAAAAAAAAAEARGTPPSNTASDRAPFVVLGSNLGTEAFFAALSLGVRVEGHEILDSLHNTATRLQHEWSVPRSGPASVHLVRGDALDADLSSARVLWMDNQVWDDRLVNAMLRKAAAELPPGALVVDFASASRPGISRDTASASMQALPLVGCAALESSWSAGRTSVAFRARVPRGDGDGVPDQHRHDATGGGHRWLWHCCASDIASGLASHVLHVRRIARGETCRSGTGGTEACHGGSVSGSAAAAEDSDKSGISVDASIIAKTFLSRNDNDEPASWKLHTTIRSSPFALAAALVVSSEFMRFRLALRPAIVDFITSAVEQAIAAVASHQDRVVPEHEQKHHQHGHRSFLMLEHIVPHEAHTLLSTGLTLDDLMPVGAASPHASRSATRTSSSRMDPALQYVHLGVGGKRRRTEEAGAAAGTDPIAGEGGASLYRRILLQLEESSNTRNGLEKSVVDGLCSNASVYSSFASQGLECTGLGFPLEEVRGKTFGEATRAARTEPTGPTEPLPAILTLAVSHLPLTRDRWHPLLRSAYDILVKAREMGIWRGGAARRGQHGGDDVSGGGGGHSGEEGGEHLEALVQLHLFAAEGGDGGDGGGTLRPGSTPVEGTHAVVRVWIVDESGGAEEGETPPGDSSPNGRRRRPYTVLRIHSVAELVAEARASPPYDSGSNVRLCEVPGPLLCSFRATYATPGVQRLLDNYLRLGMLSDSSNPESAPPTMPGNTGARTHTRRTLSHVFVSCAALDAGHTSTGTRKAKGDVGGSEEVVISMGWL